MCEGRGVKGGDGKEGVTELNSNDNENGTVLLINKNYIEKTSVLGYLPMYSFNYWGLKIVLSRVEQYILY